jgi:hypothetical protein
MRTDLIADPQRTESTERYSRRQASQDDSDPELAIAEYTKKIRGLSGYGLLSSVLGVRYDPKEAYLKRGEAYLAAGQLTDAIRDFEAYCLRTTNAVEREEVYRKIQEIKFGLPQYGKTIAKQGDESTHQSYSAAKAAPTTEKSRPRSEPKKPLYFYVVIILFVGFVVFTTDEVRTAMGSLFDSVVTPDVVVTPDGKEMTTSLTCQRMEPSLPVTCEQEYYPCSQRWLCEETKFRSFELREARGTSPWVVLITDEDRIFLGDCSLEECNEIRYAINGFIENPDETASLVQGGVKLTIEDGRLTYEP